MTHFNISLFYYATFQPMRILLMGILCVWCVTGDKMQPIVINNELTKNETTSNNVKIESKADGNTRQTRQLDPNIWTPIPAVWSPRPRSPLNTWWAVPWPFDNGHSLVRINPPSPYWHDYHPPPHPEPPNPLLPPPGGPG